MPNARIMPACTQQEVCVGPAIGLLRLYVRR